AGWERGESSADQDGAARGHDRCRARWSRLVAGTVRPHGYAHLTDGIDAREHGVAGLDRADAFWRAGIEHVAGVKRIEGRAPFNQLAAVVDHLLRVAVLLDLAIDGNVERHVIRIDDL